MPSCKGISNSYKEESLMPKRFFAATDLSPRLLCGGVAHPCCTTYSRTAAGLYANGRK